MTSIKVSSRDAAIATAIDWHVPLSCLVISPLGLCLAQVEDCEPQQAPQSAQRQCSLPSLLQCLTKQQLEPLTRLFVSLGALPVHTTTLTTDKSAIQFHFTESTLYKHQFVASTGPQCSVCLIQPCLVLLKRSLPSGVDLSKLQLRTRTALQHIAHTLNFELHEKESLRLLSLNAHHTRQTVERLANDTGKVQVQHQQQQQQQQDQHLNLVPNSESSESELATDLRVLQSRVDSLLQPLLADSSHQVKDQPV